MLKPAVVGNASTACHPDAAINANDALRRYLVQSQPLHVSPSALLAQALLVAETRPPRSQATMADVSHHPLARGTAYAASHRDGRVGPARRAKKKRAHGAGAHVCFESRAPHTPSPREHDAAQQHSPRGARRRAVAAAGSRSNPCLAARPSTRRRHATRTGPPGPLQVAWRHAPRLPPWAPSSRRRRALPLCGACGTHGAAARGAAAVCGICTRGPTAPPRHRRWIGVECRGSKVLERAPGASPTPRHHDRLPADAPMFCRACTAASRQAVELVADGDDFADEEGEQRLWPAAGVGAQ